MGPKPNPFLALRTAKLLLLLVLSLVGVLLPACDREITLVDPAPLFTFDPENAWSPNCAGLKTSLAAPADLGARPPASVPPLPPGLAISACPNPAPPATNEIGIEFRLDVRVPSVNLAIVNSSGQIVRVLMMNEIVETDRLYRVSWLLEGIPSGDYRAYFRAGQLETSGDLQVQ